nr:hypothetical protein BHM03_00015740 [Ipomoea batatas]
MPAIVIDDLRVGERSGVLNDGAADGIDPILLLLLGVSDEVHGVTASGELERKGLVEDVLGALDGEALVDGDDAARDGVGSGGGGRVFEPQKLSLLENKPTTAPGLDVVALLGRVLRRCKVVFGMRRGPFRQVQFGSFHYGTRRVAGVTPNLFIAGIQDIPTDHKQESTTEVIKMFHVVDEPFSNG